MAIPGQRFELDLDADDFTINPIDESSFDEPFRIKDIQEHESVDLPAPPAPKPSKHGFPEHKERKVVSRFKRAQQQTNDNTAASKDRYRPRQSDAAIAHAVGRRQDLDITPDQKKEISKENDRRLAAMSEAEIEDARAEIMATLSPALVERLMKKSRLAAAAQDTAPVPDTSFRSHPITEPVDHPKAAIHRANPPPTTQGAEQPRSVSSPATIPPPGTHTPSSVHFPAPPRSAADYRPLDPSSATFLTDLKEMYFPELAHEPSPTSLSWLQPQTPQDLEASSYSPALSSYPASSIRFSFRGTLIPPRESLSLPSHLGLHHHGDAPDSAGYTIPELTTLSRSTLPNQRCVAYQTVGRILFRLGKEAFGPRGSELYEALWALVEKERTLEVVMAEANRDKGHVSAKAHATEALWLWRKGCGGERGIKKPTERNAK